jgi:hypothetical protein
MNIPNIPEEVFVGFVQFAFKEMYTHGWTERRNLFYQQHNIEGEDRGQMDTFQNIMRTAFAGDMDDTLFHFFGNEITRHGWFSSYCVQQCPEIRELFNGGTSDYTRNLTLYLDSRLSRWLWLVEFKFGTDPVTEKIKDILGLDICLK